MMAIFNVFAVYLTTLSLHCLIILWRTEWVADRKWSWLNLLLCNYKENHETPLSGQSVETKRGKHETSQPEESVERHRKTRNPQSKQLVERQRNARNTSVEIWFLWSEYEASVVTNWLRYPVNEMVRYQARLPIQILCDVNITKPVSR